MKQGLGLAEKEQFERSIQRNEDTLGRITGEIKEERYRIYTQEKIDIQLMEKLKFFIEREQKMDREVIIQSEKTLG